MSHHIHQEPRTPLPGLYRMLLGPSPKPLGWHGPAQGAGVAFATLTPAQLIFLRAFWDKPAPKQDPSPGNPGRPAPGRPAVPGSPARGLPTPCPLRCLARGFLPSPASLPPSPLAPLGSRTPAPLLRPRRCCLARSPGLPVGGCRPPAAGVAERGQGAPAVSAARSLPPPRLRLRRGKFGVLLREIWQTGWPRAGRRQSVPRL